MGFRSHDLNHEILKQSSDRDSRSFKNAVPFATMVLRNKHYSLVY